VRHAANEFIADDAFAAARIVAYGLRYASLVSQLHSSHAPKPNQ
jgi:hypothetical protein